MEAIYYEIISIGTRGSRGMSYILERVLVKRAAADGEIATERDLFARLSIFDRFAKGIGRVYRHRIVG